MLVLTRRRNEAIRIAEVVTVKVIEIRGEQVVLGFDAPREIEILREELWRRQQAAVALPEEAQPAKAG